MEKDYYGFLDEVLTHHKYCENKSSAYVYSERLIKIKEKYSMSDTDLLEANEKLIREGYMRKVYAGENGSYIVTFEGNIFIQQGMYKNLNQVINTQRLFTKVGTENALEYQKTVAYWSRPMFWATLLAGLAALGLLAVEIFERVLPPCNSAVYKIFEIIFF